MRILALAPYLPSPPTFGGQRRLQGIFRALAKRHELAILALHNPNNDLESWLSATRAWCPDAAAFPQAVFGVAERQKRLVQLGSLVSQTSWDLLSHRNEALQAALRAKLAGSRWDVLLVEFAQMMVNLELPAAAPMPPILLDEHNIEFDLQRRIARSSAGLVRRAHAEINWRKLQREEVRAWHAVQGVSVTSERDLALLRQEAPEARCRVVPNGVDLTEFSPPAEPPIPDTVAFFGAHRYFPNADALRFFIGDVWPRIAARRPSARLRVVGPYPLDELRASSPDSVSFTGPVPDIAAEVGRAAVAIAPLRIGGGTRLKVVEAMALARPMVATRIGAEGLELVDGRDLILADSPDAFSAAVLRLLENPEEAAALGRRARQRVEALYGWDTCARGLEELCAEVARK